MIKIELLTKDNFNITSLDLYDRKQEVKKVYRYINNEYILVNKNYVEDWSLEEKRQIANDISSDDYISYMALDKDKVIGFIALKKELNNDYMILKQLHISKEYRGMNIGKKLFNIAKEEALKKSAKAIYISACSAEETIAFYKKIGAQITSNPIEEIAIKEPYDLQMIYKI